MYQYAELQPRQVRLLTILPGQVHDPLIGRLSIASVDDKVKFEAFSYLWGPPVFKGKIYLLRDDVTSHNPTPTIPSEEHSSASLDGGKESEVADHMQSLPLDGTDLESDHLSITESLAEGLAQFRYLDKARVVWIDQICINQNDIKERAMQVQVMGELYTNAARVLMWLGTNPEGDAPAAEKLLREIATARTKFANANMAVPAFVRVEGHINFFDLDSNEFRGEPSIGKVFSMPKRDTAEMKAVARLIDLPYWGRAWILQETTLAAGREAIWGSTHITIEALSDAVGWILQSEGGLTTPFSSRSLSNVFTCVGRPSGSGKPNESLSRGLMYMTQRQATNPVDKIYSFLGLLRDDPYITVDYEKPYIDVCIETLVAAIKQEETLDALSRTVLTDELIVEYRAVGWPTWLPDLKLRSGPVALADYCIFASAIMKEYKTAHTENLKKAHILEPLPSQANGYNLRTNGQIKDKIVRTSSFPNTMTIYSHEESFCNYVTAAWSVAHDTHNAKAFANAVIGASGSHWEKTGDLTEVNQSARRAQNLYGMYPRNPERAHTIYADVQWAKTQTYMIFALIFVFSEDHGLQKRISVTPQPVDQIVREIKLVDGLLDLMYWFFQEDARSAARTSLAWASGCDELEEECVNAVPDAKARRSNALYACQEENPEEHKDFKQALEEALGIYYPDENELAHAVTVFLLLRHEGPRFKQADVATFLSRAVRLTCPRTFFKTEKNKLGLGPPGVRDGDVIAILAGGRIPFALRPCKGEHVFIGESYVQGYMHGEDFWTGGEMPPDETITLLGRPGSPSQGIEI